jgi:hypothetical protein
MSTDERSLSPRFSQFIGREWVKQKLGTAVFEHKIVHVPNKYRFAQLKSHQERALMMATLPTGIYHKISDQSMGQKPFDAFIVCNANAFVVIYFYERGSCRTYFVPYSSYIHLRESCASPSCDESQIAERSLLHAEI